MNVDNDNDGKEEFDVQDDNDHCLPVEQPQREQSHSRSLILPAPSTGCRPPSNPLLSQGSQGQLPADCYGYDIDDADEDAKIAHENIDDDGDDKIIVKDYYDNYDLHQSCPPGKGCPGPTCPVICQLNLEEIVKRPGHLLLEKSFIIYVKIEDLYMGTLLPCSPL